MGKRFIYTIYDRVAQEASPPFEAKNDGVAARLFRRTLQEVTPADQDAYQLLRLGNMDSETLKLESEDKPVDVTWSAAVPAVAEEDDA